MAIHNEIKTNFNTGRLLSPGAAKSIDRPPQPAPALSHFLARLEDINGRMFEKVTRLVQMNDRLTGPCPESAIDKIDSGGNILSQLEQQIIIYEQHAVRFEIELERLSRV